MRDHPDIKILPPLLFILFLIIGIVMNIFMPAWQGWGFLGLFLGLGLLGLGIYLMRQSARELKKFETSFKIYAPTETIVTTGPFSWSRNPMYIAFSLIYLALGVLLANLWILLLYLPLFILVNIMIIEKEEEYLAEKFGEDYLEYKKLVRRWI